MKSDREDPALLLQMPSQHKYRKGQEIVAFQNIFTPGAAPGTRNTCNELCADVTRVKITTSLGHPQG